MYMYGTRYLLAKGVPSLSLQDNSVKSEISYFVGKFQHTRGALMAPPTHCQLINLNQIKVDGIHRPLIKRGQIPTSNGLPDRDCLKQFSGATCKDGACFPSIQNPPNSPESCYTRNSQWRNDSCFLVQSRSASGHGKALRCLSYAQNCGRKANLSMSQMETVNIPRNQNVETSMSKITRAQQIKSPLQKNDYNPHPYDDRGSRNVYFISQSSFIQRPSWNTPASSTTPASSALEKTKTPERQLVKKRKRRTRKRKCRNRSESKENNGKTNTLRNHSVEQLMNILTVLSLNQTPHQPQERRRHRSKQRTAAADHALVPWKNEPAEKLSGLCGWLDQCQERISRPQPLTPSHPLTPSPPKGPKRRFRKRRRARVLQVKGHRISPVPEMPSPI